MTSFEDNTLEEFQYTVSYKSGILPNTLCGLAGMEQNLNLYFDWNNLKIWVKCIFCLGEFLCHKENLQMYTDIEMKKLKMGGCNFTNHNTLQLITIIIHLT
jgi:hypothetical protein